MKKSSFKTSKSRTFVTDWIDETVRRSSLEYETLDVETSFGKTRVLCVNHSNKALKPLVYVPGARTCGIFLDLSNQLQTLAANHRIYLLDVVGQVGLSDGTNPSLKDASYGVWLADVCRSLEIESAVFVGASFGGQIILKLATAAPELLAKAILLNPIGFSNISFAPANLLRTLAPVVSPTRRNVDNFLNTIVFAPNDGITAETKTRVADFVENAVQNFKFAGEYPSRMPDAEIEKLTAETHLVVGKCDGLIPHQKTVTRAKKLLPNLKSVHICAEQAHGIEVSGETIAQLRRILQR
ncbi:MAG TPA: alpha/beta hydrolase [Abditibacteriaceae bacterium]